MRVEFSLSIVKERRFQALAIVLAFKTIRLFPVETPDLEFARDVHWNSSLINRQAPSQRVICMGVEISSMRAVWLTAGPKMSSTYL